MNCIGISLVPLPNTANTDVGGATGTNYEPHWHVISATTKAPKRSPKQSTIRVFTTPKDGRVHMFTYIGLIRRVILALSRFEPVGPTTVG